KTRRLGMPLGIYTWSEELRRTFVQERMLHTRLTDLADAARLATVIAGSPRLASAYDRQRQGGLAASGPPGGARPRPPAGRRAGDLPRGRLPRGRPGACHGRWRRARRQLDGRAGRPGAVGPDRSHPGAPARLVRAHPLVAGAAPAAWPRGGAPAHVVRER